MSHLQGESTTDDSADQKPPWQPLGKVDRRVVGVLVEKAKTTPSAYPLTVNAITTASNQKSNRAPLMNLEPDDVQQSLDRLRGLGAAAEIQGDGRALKYRHLMYEWLAVDKVEIAIMAELLLRGEQTLGDLRARAARMETIADQSALKPIVQELIRRGLMVALSPAGRGQIVTHNLYLPEELTRLKAKIGVSDTATPVSHTSTAAPVAPPTSNPIPAASPSTQPSSVAVNNNEKEIQSLQDEIMQLREDHRQTQEELDKLRGEFESFKSDLGV